ncbi:exodeoxyribonuclease V subunit alpha [Pelagicoccus sp. SDUM812003]|uniref:exodeoxyribonuclease V subunit alpha n=1 Tax=Pelagicoccus sp. SDUM812003 TaxID=3041267 RepID=UPI00280C63F4|nr:exodeoxyribonuclease V subunit alpha [Pelagicoccus sp. SDUM812003]MDQ8201848.1 exodeoxyribonuclease V subunit alpha [Pelagicoccus sp. SDUM812003]
MITELPASLSFLNDAPFAASDRMLAFHLKSVWSETEPMILIASALANLALREGNAYLDLKTRPESLDIVPSLKWPTNEEWAELFKRSQVVDSDSGERGLPLVFVAPDSLYLNKYYAYEKELASIIIERTRATFPESVQTSQASGQLSFDALMGVADPSERGKPRPDPVERALTRPFYVITGGPGTGKTTLALRYLNRLMDSWDKPIPPFFATVAPTGKAAARLAESLANGVDRLQLEDERKQLLRGIPCLTIHRLLGPLPHRASFRRDARNPIHQDAIVIDESSMIDLPLMLKLLQATPKSCRILLLGDKDQLASVNVGSVLADILKAGEDIHSPLRNSIERLTRTYRFSEDSAIYRLCTFAQSGDSEGFEALLTQPPEDLEFHPMSADGARLPQAATQSALQRHQALLNEPSAEAALARLTDAITLTPTRQGSFGSMRFNQTVERAIRERDQLSPFEPINAFPIIVLENNYELELFNGDLGIVWLEGEEGAAYAYFAGSDGSTRRFRLSELPRHEAAFALTIHKSQGSEFEHVTCLFGPGESQLHTRELLYTAFSRAKTKLTLFGDLERLSDSIQRSAKRATRLAELINRRAP